MSITDDKECKDCGLIKPASEFYLLTARTNPILSGHCMDCQRLRNFKNKLWRRYKLSYGQLISMLAGQKSECLICQRHISIDSLHIDHDDKLGVCGLLCPLCNPGIGMLCHDVKIILSAAEYVRKTRCPK